MRKLGLNLLQGKLLEISVLPVASANWHLKGFHEANGLSQNIESKLHLLRFELLQLL